MWLIFNLRLILISSVVALIYQQLTEMIFIQKHTFAGFILSPVLIKVFYVLFI